MNPRERLSPLYSSNGFWFDLESYLVRVPEGASVGVVDRLRITLHEQFHWIQLVSTSVGAFASLLKYNRDSSACSWLAQRLGRDEVKRHIQSRSNAKYSLVTIDDKCSLMPAPFVCSESMDIFQQVIYDTWLLQKLFLGHVPMGEIKMYKPIEEILALGLRDSTIAAKEVLYGRADYSTIPAILSEGCLRVPFHDGFLSTSDLFEATTVANDALFLYGVFGIEAVKKLFHEYVGTSYLRAIQFFFRPMSIDEIVSRFPDSLISFLIAADIALNPLLPPIDIDVSVTSWSSVLPAIRLERLAEVVRKCGLIHLRDLFDHGEVSSNTDALRKMAGLKTPRDISHLFEFCGDDDDINNLTIKSNEVLVGVSFVDSRFSYVPPQQLDDTPLFVGNNYASLLSAHREAWDLRSKKLPEIIFRGAYAANAFVATRDLSSAGLLMSIDWRVPPAVHGKDNCLYFSAGVDRAFGYRFSQASAFYYYLYDILFSTGRPDQTGLPSCFSPGSKFFETITNGFSELFGAAPWEL